MINRLQHLYAVMYVYDTIQLFLQIKIYYYGLVGLLTPNYDYSVYQNVYILNSSCISDLFVQYISEINNDSFTLSI